MTHEKNTDECREAFEKWYTGAWPYANSPTQSKMLYEAWQAAWNHKFSSDAHQKKQPKDAVGRLAEYMQGAFRNSKFRRLGEDIPNDVALILAEAAITVMVEGKIGLRLVPDIDQSGDAVLPKTSLRVPMPPVVPPKANEAMVNLRLFHSVMAKNDYAHPINQAGGLQWSFRLIDAWEQAKISSQRDGPEPEAGFPVRGCDHNWRTEHAGPNTAYHHCLKCGAVSVLPSIRDSEKGGAV